MEYDGLIRARTSPDVAGRRARNGDWQRVGPGRYLPHTEGLDDEELARVALDFAGPRALLTGLIAARALGLRWIPEQPGAQVVVPAGTRRRSSRLISVRRTAQFSSLQPWTWRGLPMAPPTRIVLDAALAASSLRDVRGVVLGAIADRHTTVEQLRATLAHEPRNGTGALRRAIHDAEIGASSPPEAECIDALRGCRLPFLANPQVWVGQHLVGIPDGYFVGLGAGWEMDSRERHDQDDTFDTTLARHDVFGGFGLVLSHLTPTRLRRDSPLAASSVLAVARARLLLPEHVREPKGLRLVPVGPLQS